MANDQDVAFPVLSQRDLAALQARSHPRVVHSGEILFREGDRNFCFFVVVDGAIEILEHSSGEPHTITVHQPGEFTGDVDMLTGRPALVTARTTSDGRVLELSTDELRRMVEELPELGEIIVKAFLMRRTLLKSGRFSPDAHRLRDFATRNEVPFTWIDLDTDEQADILLRQFKVPSSDTPLVIGRNGHLARNPSLAEFASCAGLTAELEPEHVYDLVGWQHLSTRRLRGSMF